MVIVVWVIDKLMLDEFVFVLYEFGSLIGFE